MKKEKGKFIVSIVGVIVCIVTIFYGFSGFYDTAITGTISQQLHTIIMLLLLIFFTPKLVDMLDVIKEYLKR